jgi:hypothetical protein
MRHSINSPRAKRISRQAWPSHTKGQLITRIAKNCRTSVEIIEKYYAAHIKTRLDAAVINVLRPK